MILNFVCLLKHSLSLRKNNVCKWWRWHLSVLLALLCAGVQVVSLGRWTAYAVHLLRLVLQRRRVLAVDEYVQIHLADLDHKVLANSTSVSRRLATLRRGATQCWVPRFNRRCRSSCPQQPPNRDSSWWSLGSIAVLVVHSHRKKFFLQDTLLQTFTHSITCIDLSLPP